MIAILITPKKIMEMKARKRIFLKSLSSNKDEEKESSRKYYCESCDNEIHEDEKICEICGSEN
ncbi:MAG: hypothetical protein ACFFAS_19895 [Promethearchaeota archaeon]